MQVSAYMTRRKSRRSSPRHRLLRPNVLKVRSRSKKQTQNLRTDVHKSMVMPVMDGSKTDCCVTQIAEVATTVLGPCVGNPALLTCMMVGCFARSILTSLIQGLFGRGAIAITMRGTMGLSASRSAEQAIRPTTQWPCTTVPKLVQVASLMLG